ncbi:MAG: GNAT family N-acetyltransferase [Pseudomonadota bacterium]|nr:GNAT family N-acetyltransferase [Pseudomonadota bacterium]
MENVTIAEAGLEDLNDVAFMFDQYRQFYDQDEDLELAKQFLGGHMENNTSIIFLASFDGRNCGFAQLYPTFCSVEASPILVLYDLFVLPEFRNRNIGTSLLNHCLSVAKLRGASRIDLETSYDNTGAQKLYESLGYEKDNEFYKYSLEV